MTIRSLPGTVPSRWAFYTDYVIPPDHPLNALPRTWWFPALPGLREAGDGTYNRFDLAAQPTIPVDAGSGFAWLEDVGGLHNNSADMEWSIDKAERGARSRKFDLEGLAAFAHVAAILPESVRIFAGHPHLQQRIRSATACYLDLGDFPVRAGDLDGYLIHLMSDQQWCRHWLLYVDGVGCEAVLTTVLPIGFDLHDDERWRIPDPIPLDGSIELEVCAESFMEFIHRFWVENELHFRLRHNGSLTGRLAAYAARLTVGGHEILPIGGQQPPQ